MSQGLFISLEGIDGSGKTTQLQLLRQRLELEGRSVVVVREPGGSPIAERIREVLLDASNEGLNPVAEALLYGAARAQLVAEVIRPALEKGSIVIADRYLDSTLAYQGYGRGLDKEFLNQLNQMAVSETIPHLTILLDLSPEEGAVRRRGTVPDRLEQEGLAFQERVRQGYLALSFQQPERIKVVNAAQLPEKVHEEIITLVNTYLSP